VPDAILLSSLGFCIFLFHIENETGFQTEIVLMDMGARLLVKHLCEGRYSAAKIIENRDASNYLVLAQETNIVYIFSVWDLRQVSVGPVIGTVRDMTYDQNELMLYFILENGQVHATTFVIPA
jgi:hypothetical protein